MGLRRNYVGALKLRRRAGARPQETGAWRCYLMTSLCRRRCAHKGGGVRVRQNIGTRKELVARKRGPRNVSVESAASPTYLLTGLPPHRPSDWTASSGAPARPKSCSRDTERTTRNELASSCLVPGWHAAYGGLSEDGRKHLHLGP